MIIRTLTDRGRPDPIRATQPGHANDWASGRGILLALGLEVLVTIAGYLWLYEAVGNHLRGY